MIRPVHQALLLMALACACSTAVAGNHEDARQWLERMASAMNQLSYQGTFVYMSDGDVQTMRITHMVDENGVRERLHSLSGERREIIRDVDGVRCVLGKDNAVVQDPFITRSYFLDLPIAGLDAENGNYRFETGGTARIAGHTARRVTVRPGDQYRYGYDFWLEDHTGLLLKWVLFDARKKMLAKLMFTDLRIGSEVDPEELQSDTPADQFTRLESDLPASQVRSRSNPRWQPSKLPPGFNLETHSHEEQEGQQVFEHLVYSDGLAAVSVYIESESQDSKDVEGLSRLGTAHAYSRNMGAMRVTVIGEVPAETVRTIGNAVTLSTGQR